MAENLAADQLYAELDRCQRLRQRAFEDEVFHARRLKLRAWQAGRLERTHVDLVLSPRYQKAAEFFLADIYGPKDISTHLEGMRRVVPIMVRTLPASGVVTATRGLELNALSEDLDGAMVEALGDRADRLDNALYAETYRQVGRQDDRRRQIELIALLGEALEAFTHARFIGATLKLMRKPAELAGLGELQAFLERGYSAFGAMKGGASEFVGAVVVRERQLCEALFAGADNALPPER